MEIKVTEQFLGELQNLLNSNGIRIEKTDSGYEIRAAEIQYGIIREFRNFKNDERIYSEYVDMYEDLDDAIEAAQELNHDGYSTEKWIADDGEWEYSCFSIVRETFYDGVQYGNGEQEIVAEDLDFDKNDIDDVKYRYSDTDGTYEAFKMVTPDGKETDIMMVVKHNPEHYDGDIKVLDYQYGAADMTDESIAEFVWNAVTVDKGLKG